MRFYEVLEKAKYGCSSFVLNDNDFYVHFIVITENKAKLIYAATGYNADFFFNGNIKYELVAVYAENKLYCIDTFIFNTYNGTFPENVMLLANKVGEYKKYIAENIFPDFYDRLTIDKITEDDKKNYRLTARQFLLSDEPMVPAVDINTDILEMSDVLKILCGHTTLENIAESALNNDENHYKDKKRQFEILTELISDSDIVEPWELAIAKGLQKAATDFATSPRYVTVEFEVNNKKATEKVKPMRISKCLINNNYFTKWDFSSYANGEKILNELGVARSCFDFDNTLRCKHISKITYNRKVLYQRED